MEHLRVGVGARILDCTLGLGGHSEALLAAGAQVVGVDRDPAARALAIQRLDRFGERFAAVSGTFAEVAESYAARGERFSGVLADLGVSSLQIDDADRGFSIASAAAADMRMGEGCPETALQLIDRLSEDELADIIFSRFNIMVDAMGRATDISILRRGNNTRVDNPGLMQTFVI
ncbi:MAG: 16S rRNA (cytosine(1402)-N(4))-methyltransferase, partial [Planctomycetes bacterium]|nr:16S rRNA (cytosine(1402)-N(4))-methyltransferase [Planctomycetota bacterium]